MLRLSVVLLLVVLACATAGLLGGFEVVDVNDEGVQEAAENAARAINKQFADRYHHKLVKVVKARRQVVAGFNYQLDLIVGKTNCKKQEVSYEEARECDVQNGVSTYKKCTVQVYRNLEGKHQARGIGCMLASKNEV